MAMQGVLMGFLCRPVFIKGPEQGGENQPRCLSTLALVLLVLREIKEAPLKPATEGSSQCGLHIGIALL